MFIKNYVEINWHQNLKFLNIIYIRQEAYHLTWTGTLWLPACLSIFSREGPIPFPVIMLNFCIIILTLLIFISDYSKICNLLIVQISYLFQHLIIIFFILKSFIFIWIKVLSMNNLRYLLCEKDLPNIYFLFPFYKKKNKVF